MSVIVSTRYTILGLYLYDANVIKHNLCNYVYLYAYAYSTSITISGIDMCLLLPTAFNNIVVLTVICITVDVAVFYNKLLCECW